MHLVFGIFTGSTYFSIVVQEKQQSLLYLVISGINPNPKVYEALVHTEMARTTSSFVHGEIESVFKCYNGPKKKKRKKVAIIETCDIVNTSKHKYIFSI